jgi:hypothetical protein
VHLRSKASDSLYVYHVHHRIDRLCTPQQMPEIPNPPFSHSLRPMPDDRAACSSRPARDSTGLLASLGSNLHALLPRFSLSAVISPTSSGPVFSGRANGAQCLCGLSVQGDIGPVSPVPSPHGVPHLSPDCYSGVIGVRQSREEPSRYSPE